MRTYLSRKYLGKTLNILLSIGFLNIPLSAWAVLSAPTLNSPPANGATGVSVTPTFSWSTVPGANGYWLMVARNLSDLPTDINATSCPNCVSNGISVNTVSTNYVVPAGKLIAGTVYYWKVQGYDTATTPDTQGYYSSAYSFTTAAAADTTPPVFSAFSVTPSAVTVGSAFTISYTVSDTGGLGTVSLWRAPDSGGTPGTFAQVASYLPAVSGSYSGTFSNTPASAGAYWYKLKANDLANNWATEPAAVMRTVNATVLSGDARFKVYSLRR